MWAAMARARQPCEVTRDGQRLFVQRGVGPKAEALRELGAASSSGRAGRLHLRRRRPAATVTLGNGTVAKRKALVPPAAGPAWTGAPRR
jgi:hypothetical protein